MKMKNNNEIVGTLKSYEESDNKLKLNFIIKSSIVIPRRALSNKELDNCKNKKIGIFHLNGKYYIRKC